MAVYKQSNQLEKTHGQNWYQLALDACKEISVEFELPLHIVVGVCAALSPTNRWERNLGDTHTVCRVFSEGGYMESAVVCTYPKMLEKAWSILQTMPHDAEDTGFILKGPKITDFFMCILGHDVCVIDGHAWGIANNERRGMKDVPSIGKGMRKELQAAYKKAGNKKGLTAYQMQAITWVAWKRIHNV